MTGRRNLVEGLKDTPSPADTIAVEKEFVYGKKGQGVAVAAPTLNRVPFSTRLRADFAAALKRASLERQLQGVEPNSLTDIFEVAIEPWLKANGYVE